MRLLLIDDHPLLRGGVRLLLRGLDPDLEMDEAGDVAHALECMAGRSYDLVLLDLTLPGLKGLDALAALRAAAPETPTVVLSAEEDPQMVRTAIERGAMGFIPKSSAPNVLVQALRLVLAQGVYLPPTALDVARMPAVAAANPARECVRPRLTPRQMDVLRHVIKGKSNKVIARELNVSEGTIKAHLSTVYLVLGARNRTEAVYAAAKLGLSLG